MFLEISVLSDINLFSEFIDLISKSGSSPDDKAFRNFVSNIIDDTDKLIKQLKLKDKVGKGNFDSIHTRFLGAEYYKKIDLNGVYFQNISLVKLVGIEFKEFFELNIDDYEASTSETKFKNSLPYESIVDKYSNSY